MAHLSGGPLAAADGRHRPPLRGRGRAGWAILGQGGEVRGPAVDPGAYDIAVAIALATAATPRLLKPLKQKAEAPPA